MASQEMSRRSFLSGAAAAGALAAAAGLAGCAPQTTGALSDTGSTGVDGIFEATAQVQAGEVTVHMTLGEGQIKAVDIVEYTDYPKLVMLPSAQAVADRIVEAQSTNVDVVTGATLASMAVMAAVRDCLDQAGAKGFDAAPEPVEITPGEDVEVDVLVVGSGAGGFSSALSAAYQDFDGIDSGLKVMMIEKQGYLGGTSVLSGGGVFASSPLDEAPREECILETIDILQERNTNPVNEPLVRRLLEMSGPTIVRMSQTGAPYDITNALAENMVKGSTASGDKPETSKSKVENGPTSTAFFSPTPFCTLAGLGPFNWGYAHGMFDYFNKRLERTPQLEVRMNTAAKELVCDADGAVVGVKVEDSQHTYTISAKKVILACGGITKNPELIAKYAPKDVNSIAWCCGGNTGDAITMCEPLGAQVVGDHLLGYFGSNSRYGAWSDYGAFHYGGATSIHININGERYENERTNDRIYGGNASNIMYTHLVEQPEGRGYGIIDSSNEFVDVVTGSVITDCIWTADTIDDLAAQIDVPADALRKTIDEYNQTYDDGVDDPAFGVPHDSMAPVKTPPFYAFANNGCGVGGLVGLKCNENCQILGADENPIPNLYGCGEVIYGGNVVTAHEGGWGVGVSLLGGRIAGEHAKDAILSAS